MTFDRDAELARLSAVAAQYGEDVSSITERLANDYAARRAVDQVQGPEVLVLGAATGVWAAPLLERFHRFDAVDAVAETLARLQEACGASVRCHQALFEEFEAERPYDTVVLGHVLEHVFDPVALLRRARGWLKPGGRAVILVPNARSLHRLVGVQLGLLAHETELSAADRRLGHRRVFSREGLRGAVEAAGWLPLRFDGLILKPLANSQLDAWDDRLRQAYFALGEALPEFACVILCVARSDDASALRLPRTGAAVAQKA